ncbi:hypothetical protein [Xenorhabdus bovienii]|uniref:hypothetical protein n=1 Tax=Xenorhabdus bovienii TaxID=40576 RepID=UPI00237CA8B2|nr:hypothetical protein [Xenorhabdus bovienii]
MNITIRILTPKQPNGVRRQITPRHRRIIPEPIVEQPAFLIQPLTGKLDPRIQFRIFTQNTQTQTIQVKPQFDYIIKLAQLLEVSIDHLLLGEEGATAPVFDIKNKRLKELCKQVDRLKAEDQDVICRILDMAITQEKIKQAINITR